MNSEQTVAPPTEQEMREAKVPWLDTPEELCVAQGEPEMIAALAATLLVSIHHKLGEKAFEAVIRAARRRTSRAVAEDVTDSVREGR